jgi:GNAT superfamily N-acetyltransferase
MNCRTPTASAIKAAIGGVDVIGCPAACVSGKNATTNLGARQSFNQSVVLMSILIAFARVISDFAIFANLVDVFVLLEIRGRGYGKMLMKAVIAHPELQGHRRFTLATADEHGLYAQFGFRPLVKFETFMER